MNRETFDNITWQVHDITTIAEIYFVQEENIWAAKCLIPNQSIIAHGDTPAIALDNFLDLYLWE